LGNPGNVYAIVPLLAMVNIMSENIQGLHALFIYIRGPSGTETCHTIENLRDFCDSDNTRIKRPGKNNKSFFKTFI